MAHKVEMELQLASEIDLHPEIPVNTSCQHIEELDQEKGPRLRVSPRLTTESLLERESGAWKSIGAIWISHQGSFISLNIKRVQEATHLPYFGATGTEFSNHRFDVRNKDWRTQVRTIPDSM